MLWQGLARRSLVRTPIRASWHLCLEYGQSLAQLRIYSQKFNMLAMGESNLYKEDKIPR